MKRSLILALLPGLIGMGTVTAQSSRQRDSVEVTIRLDNSANSHSAVDSVYVIFDQFNLRAAGAIRQTCYPSNNVITIPNVPEGKFYITVICLGIYKDCFNVISYVYENRKNNNVFNFRLKHTGRFDPETVQIPASKTDPLQLAIFKPVSKPWVRLK
jgi:hypothetical protein